MQELEALYQKACELAGRPVEVEKLKTGKFVVLWLRFDHKPPEPAPTEEAALQAFIELFENEPALKEDAVDATMRI